MWKLIRIADFGKVITGNTPSSSNPEHFGDSYPFITPTDMRTGRIVHTERRISEEGHFKFRRQILPVRSVCFVCIGATIGKICLTTERSLTNQQINSVVVDTVKHDPFFVFYLLSTYADKLKSIAGGAATPIVNKTSFANIEALVPPLSTQRKIAAILSAYDDLIENNLRRIKILEEMAQNLYREWFVKFRFPGHEQACFVDSPLGKIPEGWDVVNLGDHLIALESGKRPKGGAQNILNGIPSVGAENIFGIGRHRYQSEKFVSHDFFDAMRKGIVKNGDVALYKDGAYIGRSSYFRDAFPHTKFCVNEHVFLLRTTGKRVTQNVLYLWLQEPNTVSEIRANNANAAQPGINQSGVNGLKLIVPPIEILNYFDATVELHLATIISLAKKNEILRRTRDMLLPKLISGEVDVSELDITIPEEAVA